MKRFTERVERDLGQIADRATPSSTAWEAIQHRIDEQDTTTESTMEVIMISPDRNEPHNRSRTWMLVAAGVAAVALVGGLIVAANRDSDAMPAAEPTVTVVEQATEAAPTTTAAESTLAPSSGTVEVPFYVIDADIPDELSCGSAVPGFNVSFSDDSGGSTVVEARTEDDSVPDEDVNTTCIKDLFEGVPALFYAVVLDAPAAETYDSIELRYPFANGQGLPGRDGNVTVFEMVTQAEAEAGLYVEVHFSTFVALDPSEVEDFPLAD
jgi:hypothetical protein